MTRVLSQIINLVPYHRARWEAVGRLEGVELTMLQARSGDEFRVLEMQEGEGGLRMETLGLDGKRCRPSELLAVVSAAMERSKPDVVVISGYSFPVSLAMLLAAGLRRIPVVVCSESNQDDFQRNGVTEWVKGRVVRLCSAGLVGGGPQQEYLEALGMAEDRIFKGYNAVDNGHFERGSDEARRAGAELRERYRLPAEYFISVSRFTEKKNIPGLIRAYAEYRRRQPGSGVYLVLVGDGPLRGEIEALVVELGLTEWVVLPGPVGYGELPVYFGLARGFIHASTTEQWGLVVNEALAAGLPAAVSRRCGCVRDLIDGGEHGRTFDPASTDQIAEAMEWMGSMDGEAVGGVSVSARRRVAGWSPEVFAEGVRGAMMRGLREVPRRPGLLDRILVRLLMMREERA